MWSIWLVVVVSWPPGKFVDVLRWEDGTTNYAVDLKEEVSKMLTTNVPHPTAMTSYGSFTVFFTSNFGIYVTSDQQQIVLSDFGDIVELSFL